MAKILVIDDDLVAQKIYATVLKREKHEVLLASDGRVGLEMLVRNQDLDIALVDIFMPHVGGIELLKKAKSLPMPPKIRFAVMSTCDSSTLMRVAYDHAASIWAIKPLNATKIIKVVQTLLSEARNR